MHNGRYPLNIGTGSPPCSRVKSESCISSRTPKFLRSIEFILGKLHGAVREELFRNVVREPFACGFKLFRSINGSLGEFR